MFNLFCCNILFDPTGADSLKQFREFSRLEVDQHIRRLIFIRTLCRSNGDRLWSLYQNDLTMINTSINAAVSNLDVLLTRPDEIILLDPDKRAARIF